MGLGTKILDAGHKVIILSLFGVSCVGKVVHVCNVSLCKCISHPWLNKHFFIFFCSDINIIGAYTIGEGSFNIISKRINAQKNAESAKVGTQETSSEKVVTSEKSK